MTRTQARSVSIGIAAVGAAALLALVIWSSYSGGLPTSQAASLPRRAIGPSTAALAKADLKALRPATLQASLRDAGVSPSPSQGRVMEALDRARLALLDLGIRSIALPIAVDLSAFDNLGVYLATSTRVDPEEVEIAIVKAFGGSPLSLGGLMTSVTDVGGGWLFWGVKGGGESAQVDVARAQRLETALAGLSPSAAHLVLLGGAGDAEPLPVAPGEARLPRQLKRLHNAAQNMRALVVSVEPPDASVPRTRLTAQAVFISADTAQAFLKAWRGLAGDLTAAAGPTPENAGVEPFLYATLRRLGQLEPTVSGCTATFFETR